MAGQPPAESRCRPHTLSSVAPIKRATLISTTRPRSYLLLSFASSFAPSRLVALLFAVSVSPSRSPPSSALPLLSFCTSYPVCACRSHVAFVALSFLLYFFCALSPSPCSPLSSFFYSIIAVLSIAIFLANSKWSPFGIPHALREQSRGISRCDRAVLEYCNFFCAIH